MAKIDESKLGEDFSYIFRIAESDIDGLSPISIGLTSIKGIGLRTSQQICRLSGIDGKKLGGLLTDEEKDSLKNFFLEDRAETELVTLKTSMQESSSVTVN